MLTLEHGQPKNKLNASMNWKLGFDAYPNTQSPLINSTGNPPFSTFTPFGFSGRFVYGRASHSF